MSKNAVPKRKALRWEYVLFVVSLFSLRKFSLFSESKNHVQKCCPDKEGIALGRSRVSETTGGSSLPTPSTAPCLKDSPRELRRSTQL